MDRSPLTNMVLTGFMGTGKTTVGRILADILGLEFVDTDELIERRHGPISAIFREQGEARFRHIEREIASELAAVGGLVISTGGRLMLDAANVAALGAGGRVFCLVASPDVIAHRVLVPGAPVRPLLAGGDPRVRIAELLAERAAGYAHFEQVDTDGRTAHQVAEDIAERVR